MSSFCNRNRKIEEAELEKRLLEEYRKEVANCDEHGLSTQHIGDEWMRRKIREICGYHVSDRWIKQFRKRNHIRYFSGRRHFVAEPPRPREQPVAIRERRAAPTQPRRGEYSEIDSRVAEEIRRRHVAGERLTNPWILDFARKLAGEIYPEDVGVAEFFDMNWLYRFKRRYCVDLKPQNTVLPPPPAPPSNLPKPIPLYFDYYLYTQMMLNNILQTPCQNST
ncbi:unnamed protein product [Caenorhabditis angaria]|uniref:HTH CENPB-type domain-containing protein n=1 Tax=Caenorhabditis angaria TaxID=860376 RepID=A0A9P1MXB3_9PELO|nr:unnamed protein product [Caenorhabditis angaria]